MFKKILTDLFSAAAYFDVSLFSSIQGWNGWMACNYSILVTLFFQGIFLDKLQPIWQIMNSLLYSLVGIKLLTGTCREFKEQCLLIKFIGCFSCFFYFNLQPLGMEKYKHIISNMYISYFIYSTSNTNSVNQIYIFNICIVSLPINFLITSRVSTMWKELVCTTNIYSR